MTETDRRALAAARRSAETGIDEAMLERLVRSFYAAIRVHPVLGPVFEAHIDDWEEHLVRLTAFWSSVALGTGRYSGSPMRKHLPLPIDSRHFDMWLELFARTAVSVCPPDQARYLVERALRIAESLETAIAVNCDVMLARGERLLRPDADVFLDGGTGLPG
jgi:hemoglobin